MRKFFMQFGVHSENISELSDRLFSSILEEQQKFAHLKPADPEKLPQSKSLIESFAKVKGRGFFYDYFSTGRGHGPFTELVDGSIKYDLIGGIGPAILGHSHPLYIRANLEAAQSDLMMCGNLLPYNEAYLVTKKMVDLVSEKSRLRHFWFSGSGSFANDTALKIIWQKQAPKYKIIAFEKAFAGRSVATQDITYNEEYRQEMPKSVDVDHVPHFNHKDPEGSLKRTLDALNQLYEKNGDVYGGLMIELVQGEAGFVYAPKEFYEEVFKWAKAKGLYIWIDEVQTFARTRELFAFQMFGLDEYVDVVTVGKALQACGTLYTEELNPKPGLVAGTFNGGLAALLAGAKTLDYLTQGPFYGVGARFHDLEQKFISRLENLSQNSCKGKIGYCGGVGTMISFEVGDSSKEMTAKFLKELFNNGVIAFSAGKNPTRVRFLLPSSITDEHIDEIFTIIEKTVLDVFAD